MRKLIAEGETVMDLIKENEISKNKLAHRAELQRTQMN